jgi:predicted transcriptional regulator
MTRSEPAKPTGKEALKALREARRPIIAANTARMKQQRKEIAALREQLEGGAKTVPELAEAAALSATRVLWYVATLKKYGEIAEGEKDGSYFRYQLTVTGTEALPAPGDQG